MHFGNRAGCSGISAVREKEFAPLQVNSESISPISADKVSNILFLQHSRRG
jgi:hypothetical protein